MEIKFTVPGPPMGKQRPRFCKINGRSFTYTPRQTAEYEKLVKTSCVSAMNNLHSRAFFEKGKPLDVNILALFPIPQHASKKQKILMLEGETLPAKKPDCDNIIKIILDALNGICYYDDSQICRVYLEKMYADIPETKIIIREIEQ